MANTSKNELRQLLHIFRRRWYVVVLAVAVAATTAFLYTRRLPKTYQASVQVEVQPLATDSSNNFASIFIDPQTALQTDADLIASDAVLVPAAKSMNLASDAPLKGSVAVSIPDSSQILDIKVTTGNPAQSADWANGIAKAFIAYVRGQAIENVEVSAADLTNRIAALSKQIAETKPSAGGGTDTVSTLQSELTALQAQLASQPGSAALNSGGGTIILPATAPTVPYGPHVKLNTMLGGIVGLLLGCGLVLLVEGMDERMRTVEEVERRTAVPCLGTVPTNKRRSGPGHLAAMMEAPDSNVAEAYRTLRTNLRFLASEREMRTILVTSSLPSEGKSTTAANLAAALAVSGTKTVLVSADLRRPTVHRFFGLNNKLGISDVLFDGIGVEYVIQGVPALPDFRLLAAGRERVNPAEVLASTRFASLIDSLKAGSDAVVIDAPPVLGLSDVAAIGALVDAVVLVVRPGVATRSSVHQAAQMLRRAGAALVGTVLNGVNADDGYGYYGDMAKYYETDDVGPDESPASHRAGRASSRAPSQLSHVPEESWPSATTPPPWPAAGSGNGSSNGNGHRGVGHPYPPPANPSSHAGPYGPSPVGDPEPRA